MESLIVSASMGAMNPLLGKLSRLITEEQAKLKERERKEVISLKDELGSMVGLFRGSAMLEDPDVQVKEWMRQVREVAYDTEDWLDLFLHHQLRRELNFLGRLTRSRSKRLVGQIRQLTDRIVAASKRRKRYKLVEVGIPKASAADADVFGASSVAIDPRLLDREETTPVAIDQPKGKLINLLEDDQQHLRVVSIVGIAGIGKTTLAKQVYRSMRMGTTFHCQAFVYVGQRPSVRAVVMDILRQVLPQAAQKGGGGSSSMSGSGEIQAIAQLRDFLQDKRYLVVFDDVWSISAWKAINCGLPANSAGSRIIATTRNYDVAKSCSNYPGDDVIHAMEYLDQSNSERLFHSRIFGSEEEKCPEHCSQVHVDVVKICGGLPLAILVVASLLARKYAEQAGGLKMIDRPTFPSLEQCHHPLKMMRKVLQMSYADLPLPVKSCLLYLSVFPKNYTIDKDRLIWRWVAEGFVPTNGKLSTLETGRSYFNELINRSLIQPVLADEGDDEPTGCTVHAAVHEFVVALSTEENFVTLDESMQRDVVRRLSLNYAKEENGPWASDLGDHVKINLSQARYLTVSGLAQRMPQLANFLLLRVLDLEDAEKLECKRIEDIGRLFNLRYLGLGGEHLTELPESIGELQFLETLELRRTSVRRLPPAASRLLKLARLLTKLLDDIPDGIEKMQDLQELSTMNVSSRRMLDLMAELVKLRKLRALGLKWGFQDELHGDEIQTYRSDFVSSLNKIEAGSSFESLILHAGDACSLDFLAKGWVPPRLLQKLVVKTPNYYFPATPVHLASCTNLTYLEIAINLSREEDLSIIANLPELTTLKLFARETPIYIRRGFLCLKVFWFDCRGCALRLVFEGSPMPQLRKLHVSFKLFAQQQAQDSFCFGLQNLCALKQVHANIDCDGASVSEVNSMEDAITKGVSMHPNKPALELRKDN